jgi:hypothetical protein
MSEPAPRVHLVQCLCPARHCIMAGAGEEPPGTAAGAVDGLKAGIEEAIAAGGMNPWCELCRAPRDQWSFEVATIENRKLAELLPALKHQEAAQLATQAAIIAERRASRN